MLTNSVYTREGIPAVAALFRSVPPEATDDPRVGARHISDGLRLIGARFGDDPAAFFSIVKRKIADRIFALHYGLDPLPGYRWTYLSEVLAELPSFIRVADNPRRLRRRLVVEIKRYIAANHDPLWSLGDIDSDTIN